MKLLMVKSNKFHFLDGSKIKCYVCRHSCSLNPSQFGLCKSYIHFNGSLFNVSFLEKIEVSTIESQHFYHFWPGHKIFVFRFSSFAGNTINFFENFTRSLEEDNIIGIYIKLGLVENLYDLALKFFRGIRKNISEYKTLTELNPYLDVKTFKELLDYVDAFLIPVLGFDERSFNKVFAAPYAFSNLLDLLEILLKRKKHFELLYYAIEDINTDLDYFRKFLDKLRDLFGVNLIIHILRGDKFFGFKRYRTTNKVLRRLYNVAKSLGFVFSYVDDFFIGKEKNTFCPSNPKKQIIIRIGNWVKFVNKKDNCFKEIPIVGNAIENIPFKVD